MHDETLRMLGKEHEADLEREARKWQRAGEVGRSRRGPEPAPDTAHERQSGRVADTRIVAFLLRMARA
jgi:hypothetical protein